MGIETILKEYGVTGAVVIGCAYIFRIIIMWLLEQVNSRNAMLDQRHTELIDINRGMIAYINESKEINKELITEIRSMGEGICSKIDSIANAENK